MEYKDFEPSIIQDRILKLCRRLKNCTLDDLASFLDTDSAIIETVLLYLEQDELININDDIVTVNFEPKKKSNIEQKNLSLMREFISEDKFEIIMKSFCLLIPPQKTNILINTGKNSVCNYYAIFRDMIYKRQLKELLNLFFKRSQIGRYRKFYDKYAYFYTYNNKVFVCDKLLRGNLEKNYTKEEIREFKVMYNYLARVESHNINEAYMYQRLAEYIWRRDKNYDELYSDLKNNLLS